MPNSKRHLHNLFLHLVKTNSHQAVVQMTRLLEDEGRGAEIDWQDLIGKRPLSSACLLQAENAMKLDSRNKEELEDHQRRLARVMIESGVELSDDSALMEEALKRGHGGFVEQAVEINKLTDTPKIESTLKKMNVSKALSFINKWEDNPAMERIVEEVIRYLREEAWLKKGVSQKAMTRVRRGHSWTRQQASDYMKHRLFPDWKNRQYSGRALDIPLDPMLSEDRIPLIEKIPAQTWEETLLAGEYKDKDAQMLKSLSEMMGKRVETLAIPLPDSSWIRQYVDCRYREIQEDHPERDGAVEWWLAGRYIQDMENSQWSWDGVGAALGCMLIGSTQFRKKYDKEIPELAELNEKINLKIKEHLSDTPPGQLSGDTFVSQTMVEGKWIRLGDAQSVDKYDLPSVPCADPKDDLYKKNSEFFHYYMTLSCEDRLDNPDYNCASMPKVASAFWFHLIHSSGTGINKVLDRVMDRSQEERMGDRVWKIQRGDKALTALLETKKAQDFLKSKGNKAKTQRKNALLKLQAILARGYEDELQAETRRPKI